jgi:REP-associated tyrosine transposase
MARPLRIEFAGALYHITSRGNARGPIFLDRSDWDGFLDILSSVIARFEWVCHAYCLMENHYHLIVETARGNLSRGMRQLNGVYTQFFNRRHKKVGHLFQGRYNAVLVEKESHLLSLCRYVVLNPVRAKLVRVPGQWRWSSYRATVGQVERPPFLRVDWVLGQFGRKRAEAVGRYRRFIWEGVGEKSPWESLRGQILLGKDEFVGRIQGLLKGKEKILEVPKVQRFLARPSLEELFQGERSPAAEKRDEGIYRAYRDYGYYLREIADYLRVHYATVSRGLNRATQAARKEQSI